MKNKTYFNKGKHFSRNNNQNIIREYNNENNDKYN